MAEVPPFLWADAGTFASPKVYEVPGSGEVQPYTATATYVNASGQAILPALRLKSDSGNLLSLTFPVGQTIAAGSSAEVTFVPPFGSASGSGGASTTAVMAVAYRDHFDVPSTAGGSSAHFNPWDYIDTSGADIDLDGSGYVRINSTGLYYCICGIQIFDSTWAVTVNMDFNFNFITGGAGNTATQTWPGQTNDVNGLLGDAGSKTWLVYAHFYVNILTAPESLDAMLLSISGAGAHQATGTFAVFTLQRVGDAPNMALN